MLDYESTEDLLLEECPCCHSNPLGEAGWIFHGAADHELLRIIGTDDHAPLALITTRLELHFDRVTLFKSRSPTPDTLSHSLDELRKGWVPEVHGSRVRRSHLALLPTGTSDPFWQDYLATSAPCPIDSFQLLDPAGSLVGRVPPQAPCQLEVTSTRQCIALSVHYDGCQHTPISRVLLGRDLTEHSPESG